METTNTGSTNCFSDTMDTVDSKLSWAELELGQSLFKNTSDYFWIMIYKAGRCHNNPLLKAVCTPQTYYIGNFKLFFKLHLNTKNVMQAFGTCFPSHFPWWGCVLKNSRFSQHKSDKLGIPCVITKKLHKMVADFIASVLVLFCTSLNLGRRI